MAKDALASGQKSATFSAGGKSKAQKEWDYIFMDEDEFLKVYGEPKTKEPECPTQQ